jgi:hypothetical protein
MKGNANSIHGQTLLRNAQFLEKHLDPIRVILYDNEDLLSQTERRRVAAKTTKREQNATILSLVAQKGFFGYQKLLRILQNSKQEHLRAVLVKCERVVKLEKQTGVQKRTPPRRGSQFSTLEGRPWSRTSAPSRPRSQEGEIFNSCATRVLPPRPGSYAGEYVEDVIKEKNDKIRRLSISTVSSISSIHNEGRINQSINQSINSFFQMNLGLTHQYTIQISGILSARCLNAQE